MDITVLENIEFGIAFGILLLFATVFDSNLANNRCAETKCSDQNDEEAMQQGAVGSTVERFGQCGRTVQLGQSRKVSKCVVVAKLGNVRKMPCEWPSEHFSQKVRKH